MKRYIRSSVVDLSDESWEGLACIAAEPTTRPEVLRKLYKELDIFNKRSACAPVLLALAENPSTPEDVLESLFIGGSAFVKRNLVLNPNLPDHLFEAILDDHHILYGYIINDPDTPAEVLTRIANDENIDTSQSDLYALARHKNLPDDLRERLISENPEWSVCVSVDFRTAQEDFDTAELTAKAEATIQAGQMGGLFRSADTEFSEQDTLVDGTMAYFYTISFQFDYHKDIKDMISGMCQAVDELLESLGCSPFGHDVFYDTWS